MESNWGNQLCNKAEPLAVVVEEGKGWGLGLGLGASLF